jgi:hypothetical protein
VLNSPVVDFVFLGAFSRLALSSLARSFHRSVFYSSNPSQRCAHTAVLASVYCWAPTRGVHVRNAERVRVTSLLVGTSHRSSRATPYNSSHYSCLAWFVRRLLQIVPEPSCVHALPLTIFFCRVGLARAQFKFCYHGPGDPIQEFWIFYEDELGLTTKT